MNNQELFELRKKYSLKFENPGDLVSFLDGLFVEEVKLPLVVGIPKQEKDWKIYELAPQTINDELTVRNYIQGLREFRESSEKDKDAQELLGPNFYSMVFYNGIDSNDGYNQDGNILNISLGFVNSSRNRTLGGYHLFLRNGGLLYDSRTKREKTRLDEVMESHMGPK